MSLRQWWPDSVLWPALVSKAARYGDQAARWLDRQPPWRVLGAGLVGGVGIGVPGFIYGQSPLWLLFWGGLFVALWCLGHSAAPVFEEDNPLAARPQRLRDGPFVMMALPGGSFCMGSPDTDDMARDDEKPQHQVTVAGFHMAITTVTAGVYHEVMRQEEVPAEQAQLPAVDVRWEDAVAFCNRLSARQGYRLCYRQQAGGWVCDWDADGYRLPTEAEWEYACRAGTTTRYSFGDNPQRLERYAWFGEGFSRTAHEVAQKAPNPWGLYDMHGNVWEWCWDVYAPYTARSVKNPPGPKQPKSNADSWRVVRGGSFDVSPGRLRSAYRGADRPEGGVRVWSVGFRCVRVPPQP